MTIVQKKCTKCQQEKKLSEFYKKKSSLDGYRSQCKSCHNSYSISSDKTRKRALELYHRNKVLKGLSSYPAKVTKPCSRCGVDVTRKPSKMRGKETFCSMKCTSNTVEFECLCCGEKSTKPVSQAKAKRLYCSKKCYDTDQTSETFTISCLNCKKDVRYRLFRGRNHRKFCGRKCQNEYMVWDKHPMWNGGKSLGFDGINMIRFDRINKVSPYIRSHRLVVSGYLGRVLRDEEHVIHVNGNRNDNDPSNLYLCDSISECQLILNSSLPWPGESNLNEKRKQASNRARE